MPIVTRRSLFLLGGLAIGGVAVAGFVWFGAYNVGADDPHIAPVYALMETIRDQSIRSRAKELEVPDLESRERIVQGAGNYNAMCTGCHLKPGVGETELSKGLYPTPPDLTRTEIEDAEAFWVIKHGIKASGMPAWGKSMQDEYIWNMVAFIRQLPTLDAQSYGALVASSGGHSHGGGEADGHQDVEAEEAPHEPGMVQDVQTHEDHAPMAEESAPMTGTTHVHADGMSHVHTTADSSAANLPSSAQLTPSPAEDAHQDHDHQD